MTFFRRLLASLLLCCALISSVHAQETNVPNIYNALTQVPDWLNTSRALTPDDLKGRIILVDFWTYCCINCIHVMPKLHALEEEFGDKLTVIGVHSAKFANEGDTANIREAIQKYDLRHPVVNDADFLIWNNFGINAWPTLLLIGPDGLMKQVYRGEGDIDAMRSDIKTQIRNAGDKLVTASLPIALEIDKVPPTVLRFPTKLAVKDANTLVISDTGHERIVTVNIATHKIIQTIGSGQKGFRDGSLQEAQFDTPQGIAVDGDQVFVADTGNHRLRQIDLKAGEVTTLAGTGERGGSNLFLSHKAMTIALASPWDVTFYPDRQHLVIANAGSHQLWSYDRTAKTVSIIAGSGQENIADGALPFNALAQTSGLSVQGDKLYFADAETSSLREFDGTNVTTLIGTGLFDFGLRDGDKDTALLQHPIGLYADTDAIYVADTYNHKIRKYKDGQLTTLPLDGLKEPNDILKIGDTFYIADTNNHRIVTMNARGKMLGTLDVMPADKPVTYQEQLPNAMALTANVAPETMVHFDLAHGWHINPDAPSYLALFDADKNVLMQYGKDELQGGKIVLPVLQQGRDYHLQGVIYYCQDKKGAQCLIHGVQAHLTVLQSPMEQSTLPITLPTPAQ